MASWSVLVTIHNLVNIPLAACENGPRTFAVEAHMLHRASAYSAPVAAAIFTTDDVVSTTPNLFEVRLDEIAENNSGNGGGPKVWRCALPEMEAVVMVKEIVGGFAQPYRPRAREDDGTFTMDGSRVVGSSAPVALNVKNIVELDKLTTRVVGTEMGQVGLSFAVDPGDKIGYRHRLEEFLRQHNPQGLRLVPNVVEVVAELDTFTKLYRRYKLCDYEARLAAFFDVYGAQFKREIPSLLRQWEGREEELMRNLILDNGPELSTVEPHQRLTAYLASHQLDRNHPDVQAILAKYADAPDTRALFAALVERYGPEPDPRTYLFVTPRYTPAPALLESGGPSVSYASPPSYAGRPHAEAHPSHSLSSTPRRLRGTDDAKPRRSPPTPAGGHPPLLSVPLSPTPKASEEVPVETARTLSQSPSFRAGNNNTSDGHSGGAARSQRADAHSLPHRSTKETMHSITPEDEVVVSDKAGASRTERGGSSSNGITRRGVTLWRKMCSMMQARHRDAAPWREYQLFYMHPDEFAATVRALRVFNDSESDDGEENEVQALVAEWRRRVGNALREEALTPNDAYYGAAVQEMASLTRLLPLHIQVLALTSLFHKEQYAGFSAYVEEEAKAATTERLALVGDARRLLDIARYGFHAAVDATGSTYTTLKARKGETSSGKEGSSGAPVVFFREPFAHCDDRMTCSVLICEVAVGNTCTLPGTQHTPRDPTADFLAEYDSCAYVDEAKGPALAVYAPQQIFPRLLLQCVVDPRLQPCPAHPDKAVEYYVMDTHAFACSRCVVLGAYKGKEVIPLEEAAVLARGGLAEIERTTSALRESMLAYGNQLRNEETSMASAPRRVEAEREIDRLQKEVEERIRTIRRQVHLEDEAELSRIQADRTEVEATLAAVGRLTSRLQSAMHLSTPVATVNALQHLQQENEVEQLLARVQARVPTAPLERVLPLDGPSSPPHDPGVVPPAVAGLNESRLPTKTERQGEVRAGSRQPPPTPPHRSSEPPPLPSAPASAPPLPRTVASGSGDLYAQYLAVAANGSVQQQTPSSRPLRSEAASAHRRRPVSLLSTDASDDVDGAEGPQSAKEALTRGWALLRRGDVAGAQRVWMAVCRAHGTEDVMGTKAHAYLAEAIQKDYAAAAQWYARSLQLDPQDRMTAYNYGVLLEALLDQPQEALRMYDRAASLGDTVAAARARELRAAAATAPTSSARR